MFWSSKNLKSVTEDSKIFTKSKLIFFFLRFLLFICIEWCTSKLEKTETKNSISFFLFYFLIFVLLHIYNYWLTLFNKMNSVRGRGETTTLSLKLNMCTLKLEALHFEVQKPPRPNYTSILLIQIIYWYRSDYRITIPLRKECVCVCRFVWRCV